MAAMHVMTTRRGGAIHDLAMSRIRHRCDVMEWFHDSGTQERAETCSRHSDPPRASSTIVQATIVRVCEKQCSAVQCSLAAHVRAKVTCYRYQQTSCSCSFSRITVVHGAQQGRCSCAQVLSEARPGRYFSCASIVLHTAICRVWALDPSTSRWTNARMPRDGKDTLTLIIIVACRDITTSSAPSFSMSF